MGKRADLLKPWREAVVAEWQKSLDERMAEMTEAERINFMRWFVGDAEAKALARRINGRAR